VTGGLHIEPLERIGFFAGERFVEVVAGVCKLRGEFGDQVGANFVTALAYGWAEGGEKIARFRAKFKLHAAYGFFGDTGKGTSPARVNGGNGAFFGIDEEDGNAVGGLYGE